MTQIIDIEAIGKGDHNAFTLLFKKYKPLIRNYLLGFIKDEDEVLDVVQNLFEKLWINHKSLSSVKSIKAYLFQMARNGIYNVIKQKNIRRKHMEQYNQQFFSARNILEEQIFFNELELLIDITIERMPPQRKYIFKLSRKNGLSNNDISHKLGIKKRTVENHITQALADLKKVINTKA